MRIRYMKEAPQILEEASWVVPDGMALQGHWKEHFDTEAGELCLEIGCGMGRFISQMAARHPEQGWIGLERISSVLARGIKRLEKSEEARPNLRFLRGDAVELRNVFGPGELDRIYLNFSDPWPKERHAKRRLTAPSYLAIYRAILREDGLLQMKTDNEILFDFSLEQLQTQGWRVLQESRDLHGAGILPDNVMTEYEEKFVKQGKKICFLQAVPQALAKDS